MAPDVVGELDIREEVVDRVVKNFALEKYAMKQVCNIVKTNGWQQTYYQETRTQLTANVTTGDAVVRESQVPRGANFPYGGPTWTETAGYVVKHGMEGVVTWEDKKQSAFDVYGRTLLRIAEAIAHSVDSAIITELATTSSTNTSLGTWDNTTESLQLPLKDILRGQSIIATYNYDPYTNGFIILHPTNFYELMNNPVCRNAGVFYTDSVTKNGRVGKIAGMTIIVNNASTENTVLMCVKGAVTWYQAAPLTTKVVEDPGVKYTIRAWEAGIPVLVEDYAAYKITAA